MLSQLKISKCEFLARNGSRICWQWSTTYSNAKNLTFVGKVSTRMREMFSRNLIACIIIQFITKYWDKSSLKIVSRWVFCSVRPSRLHHQRIRLLVLSGVLLTDYLIKHPCVLATYVIDFLDQFDENIKAIRIDLQWINLDELRYELMKHPPFSPDLAGCSKLQQIMTPKLFNKTKTSQK